MYIDYIDRNIDVNIDRNIDVDIDRLLVSPWQGVSWKLENFKKKLRTNYTELAIWLCVTCGQLTAN